MTTAEPDRPLGRATEAAWRRWLARLGIEMRPGEGLPAVLLFATFFLLIAFQYAAKSVRQSTFIDKLGYAKLPYVYFLVALCSYPLLRVYSRLADRLSRHGLITATGVTIAASMAGFWWLFQYPWAWVPVLFYIWLSIAVVMTVSQFWSFANLALDPRQAKRLFGFVGAGGLLGGIFGGQVARVATDLVGTRYALLVAAGLLLAGVGLILIVNKLQPAEEVPESGATGLAKLQRARGGLEALKQSRHLRLIAALMLLTVMVAQIVDLQFNWAVEQATTTLDQRTAFFGNFYSIMGVSAFVFQLLFTARIHRLLGVGFAMRVLPGTMAVGTGVLFVSATLFPASLLMAALVLKVGENGLRYSLDQATRELLFLPVPASLRIKAKAFIDVFVQRGAKGLAAVLLLTVTFGLLDAVQVGWISLALIVLWLLVIAALRREYVTSFRRGLRQRSLDTAVPINLADVTTLELLVQSLGSSDRRQVLHALDLLTDNGKGQLVPPLLLYHDDPEVRQRTLEVIALVDRRDAAHLVERRLGDDDPDVRAEAVRVLAGLQGQQASHVMLERLRDSNPGVRAAAVACLANHGTEENTAKALEALSEMLSDGDPDVRVEASKALGTIREPTFKELLVQLLYDDEPEVVRGAISAVTRRAARDEFNPLYLPSLVSLLQNRHLKHETRQALVAFGEPVVPALAHFMGDEDEQIWVRRAIPKALASMGTKGAIEALVAGLGQADDRFLRRKIIEALAATDVSFHAWADGEVVAAQIEEEAGRYFAALGALCALSFEERGRFEGSLVAWSKDADEPSLLQQLLAERLEDHVRNVFGLLCLLHPPEHVRAAGRSFLSRRRALRSHVLEFLDNTLTGDVRRAVFAVIGDQPLAAKLRDAEDLCESVPTSRLEALRGLIEGDSGSADDAMLSVAVLYTVHVDEVSDLFGRAAELAESAVHSLVRETAGWVSARHPPPASGAA